MKILSNPCKIMKMTSKIMTSSQKYMDIYNKPTPILIDTTLQDALVTKQVTNISFMTSCSNNFQKKNVNKTLYETKEELDNIFDVLKNREHMNIKKKLNVCCITECPIDGKIDIDYILHEILMYNTKYDLDEIRLFDTCGTLKYDDYKYIVDALIYFGVLRTKVGVNLKMDTNNNKNEINKIVNYSLKNKLKYMIYEFKQSALKY
jgi:isopropylmalate/homocitrate/citramalate synthase